MHKMMQREQNRPKSSSESEGLSSWMSASFFHSWFLFSLVFNLFYLLQKSCRNDLSSSIWWTFEVNGAVSPGCSSLSGCCVCLTIQRGWLERLWWLWQTHSHTQSAVIICPHTHSHTQQLTAPLQVPLISLMSIFFFFCNASSPRKHARVLLLSPQRPRKATTQTAAAISGPSCRHVCSAAYLFKPAAGPGGPAKASPGASPACLRIHSHLRIKLLTLMLLVMLGPAPTSEPINLLELGSSGRGDRFRHDT